MIFLETCQLLLQLFVSTNLQINLCTVITPAFKCYVALRLFSYRPQMASKMCWDTRRSWECRRCSYHILTSSVIWFRPTTTWNLFLAHSCWKQWMRYRSGADVDGSCRLWKEVVFRGRKLHYGPWREAVSHATPPHLMKVKINFAVTSQKSISIRGSHIGKPCICVRLQLVWSNHCSIFVLVLGSSSTYAYTVNTLIITAKIV